MFDWTTHVQLADDFLDNRGDEAAQRSAMSRSYYAVFHAARDFLDRKGPIVTRGGTAHAEVRFRTGRIDRTVGELIYRLHRRRKMADYDDQYPADLASDAQDSVETAKKIIEGIARLK